MRRIGRAGPFALLAALWVTGAHAAPDGGTVAAASGVTCPLPKPTVVGPKEVRPGETYSILWKDVVAGQLSGDVYAVARSFDPSFASGVEVHPTDRPSYTFPPLVLPGAGVTAVYHRISAKNPCPPPNPVVVSDVFAVPVNVDCPTPASPGGLVVSPESPPAGTSYVVSWGNAAEAPTNDSDDEHDLRYRLRRTTSDGVKDWLTERRSASFVDGPGSYVYEVRVEASCGAVGPWTPARQVVVMAPPPRLVLVAEPQPIVVTIPLTASAGTRFSVRNAGTGSAQVTVSPGSPALSVDPAGFTLAPDEVREIAVTLQATTALGSNAVAKVVLDAGAGVVLAVPINFVVASAPAATPVLWTDNSAEANERADPIPRTIVNPNATPASFTAIIRQPWLSVRSLDGETWNRPMAAGETRGVLVVIDRTERNSPTGTETGTVTLVTAGAAARPSTLVIVDDGVPPPVTATPGGTGSPTGPGSLDGVRTRILFPSLANTPDGKGIGWFSSDLWVTNSDAVSAADVTLLLTPVSRPALAGPGVAVPPPVPTLRQFDARLGPGETRRFRNVVKVAGLVGASSLEVRSKATTITATAVVMNEPLPAASASRGSPAPAMATSGAVVVEPTPRVFGAEMRPVSPGEGAKVSDPEFVVSGLTFDANRRSNLLLAETSGQDTSVQIRLFQSDGQPVTKGGQPVEFTVTVGASQTVQINYPDLFDAAATYASPYSYAIVTFQPGAGAGGSVVPLATVLDNRTQDFSLHVGSSTRSLDPTKLPSAQAVAGAGQAFATSGASSLPYGGGPSPLYFPVGHSIGAPLSGGMQPFWRTRVTMTNTNATETRQAILTLLDQTGNAPITRAAFVLPAGQALFWEDILVELFALPEESRAYGGVRIEASQRPDGTWSGTWQDVDVQTEIYTIDPSAVSAPAGEFRTGMEAYPYWHGYSSFQSNLGTVQMEGAETSSRYRTNLILQEVGGAPCEAIVAVYAPGSFVPLAQTTVSLAANDYLSRELFRNVLGLDIGELTDVRVVVRQSSGDGVVMAFVSKINLATGDPANIFLRPAMAGTGR